LTLFPDRDYDLREKFSANQVPDNVNDDTQPQVLENNPNAAENDT